MDEEIEIVPIGDRFSWDIIHDILYSAHESNRKNGVFMKTAELSGDELKERVGNNGQCFVAVVNGKAVGTASVKIVNRNKWYHKGSIGYLMLSGIYPEYKGLGIFSKLDEARYDFCKKAGVNAVEFDTAEGNLVRQNIALKHGFRYVAIKASPYTKHYSVIMAMWLGENPFSDFYCKFRFFLQSAAYKLRYKRGHIKRFGI